MKSLSQYIIMALLAGSLGAQTGQVTELSLTVGRSRLIDAPAGVERVAVASGDVLEAVAISPQQVMINGKAPGETSLIIWARSGGHQEYLVRVDASQSKVEKIRVQLRREIGADVDLEMDTDTVYLRGTVADLSQAERAVAIVTALGKTVNLLRVKVPAADPEILLKIRFADVDRAASTQLGANFFSTGAGNTIGSVGTEQFAPPTPSSVAGKSSQFTISDALNLFLFRPDLNLGATIKALQSKNLIQILAEPNLLATAGREASFLAGGEFPYPVVQSGGAGLNTVTIQFREFGIRIRFLPTVTPRGTIHLQVAPEVSALDYANGLTYQGFTVPGLSVRRVSTDVELESGQSFAIAGLLDNRVTENLSKVPGLGDIPLFGRLFQSRAVSRNKSELLVVVTPELVRPAPAGTPAPELDMPLKFMKTGDAQLPTVNQPNGVALPAPSFLPVERLLREKAAGKLPEPQTLSGPGGK